MNGTFTVLAFAMAGLGITPPEHIPPAEVSTAAYQRLDCGQLMQAAEVVDDDLARAWDRQETLLRHRFGAPAPVVRRSEMQVSQLKGELEAIWRVADQKACADAPESTDLAWAPGREPGPMLGESRPWPGPRESGAGTFGDEPYADGPDQNGPGADAPYADGPEGYEPYADEPPPPEDGYSDEYAGSEESEPLQDSYGQERDWVEAPPPEGPREFEGYQDRAPSGPAAWPDAAPPAPPPAQRRTAPNGDVEWPAPSARPTTPVQQSKIPSAREL